jgi:hypothetical protein
VARKKERSIRRRERRERRSEEFRLREQQGLSSSGTEEYSSSGEEEEEEGSDGGRAPPERWEPSPPSPRAAEAAEETVPGADAGAPAVRQLTREATKCRCAPRRRPGVRRRPHRWRRRRQPSPEEKEKGIFHPEVSGRFPSSMFLDWPGPKLLVFVLAAWRPPCPLSRLPRC